VPAVGSMATRTPLGAMLSLTRTSSGLEGSRDLLSTGTLSARHAVVLADKHPNDRLNV
jgi:hypothetical protein